MSQALGAGPPAAPQKENTKGALITAVGVVVAALIGAIALALTAAGGEEEPSASSPTVRDVEVKWLGDAGRYAVSGTVDNLADGKLIWTFNQRFDDVTREFAEVRPDFGPCPVEDGGDFNCRIGFAGNEDAAGHPYMIWVVVVDQEGAYRAAEQKFLDGAFHPDDVPQVEGERTVVKVKEFHP